jgi:predicted anti-sigma-YlaC factor YlaD
VRGVDCERCRELLSASLDGEVSDLEAEAMERHVRRCGSCATYRTRLEQLHLVSRPASDDGREHVDRRANRAEHLVERLAWSPGSEAPDWARYGLLAVALMQVVVAVPQLLASGSGTSIHDQHHLGAWEAAFGVSLVIVAWQPERARGLLPFAAALSIGLAVTALSDAIGGRVSAMAESYHLLQVAGLVLLWIVGRAYRIRTRRPRRPSGPPSSPDAVGIAGR